MSLHVRVESGVADCLEDGRKVSERLFGLSLNAVTDGTRSRVDSRRSGAEHDAARNDRMAVRAERCRELVADYGLSGHVLASLVIALRAFRGAAVYPRRIQVACATATGCPDAANSAEPATILRPCAARRQPITT
jgi:hypothetical protein